MEIGERLRQYRKAKGFSIYKLSKDRDISQNDICGIENGKRQPTVETLRRLVMPMGITLAELFNENEQVSFLTPDERELVENYRSMPKESAKLLYALGNTLSNKK